MKFKKSKELIALVVAVALCMSLSSGAGAKSKIKSKSIAINVNEATMAVGSVITLSADMNPLNSTDTITWNSSDEKVATVNKYGVVTAIGNGESTITVKTSSKKKAKCVITVKSYISTDEAVKLISQNILSKDDVKKLISDNALSTEDVKRMIQENSITEATVKELIANNTLSEADIKKIVNETVGANSNSNNNSNSNASNGDWEDGMELALYASQKLPISLSAVSSNSNNTTSVTVKNISVKKYHCDKNVKGGYNPYKYVLEIEGTVESAEHAILNIYFSANNGTSAEYRLYYLDTESTVNTDQIYDEEDGTFHLVVEQYNMVASYDTFYIGNVGYVGY